MLPTSERSHIEGFAFSLPCDPVGVVRVWEVVAIRRSRPAVMQMRPLRGLWGTFNGAAAPPHSQRPRRGQTTVTAGLDLRIATTSHTCTTPTGSHGRERANPSMCATSPRSGASWGLDPPQVKTCGYANATSPRSVGNETRRGSALQRRQRRLTRPCGRSFISRLQSFFVGFCSSVKDSLTKYYTSSITYSSNSERGMLASHESTSKYWQLVA